MTGRKLKDASEAGEGEDGKGKSPSVLKQAVKIKLIDHQRAQNVMVTLSKFKAFESHQAVVYAIGDLDSRIDATGAQLLLRTLPKLDEAKVRPNLTSCLFYNLTPCA